MTRVPRITQVTNTRPKYVPLEASESDLRRDAPNALHFRPYVDCDDETVAFPRDSSLPVIDIFRDFRSPRDFFVFFVSIIFNMIGKKTIKGTKSQVNFNSSIAI